MDDQSVDFDRTALHRAVANGRDHVLDTAKTLVDQGRIDMAKLDKEGRSAWQIADANAKKTGNKDLQAAADFLRGKDDRRTRGGGFERRQAPTPDTYDFIDDPARYAATHFLGPATGGNVPNGGILQFNVDPSTPGRHPPALPWAGLRRARTSPAGRTQASARTALIG